MPPTLHDIARATQLSISTVSRALSGGVRANRLTPATRQRIHAAAAELGYRPNLLARTLRTRRSNTIGLVVNDIGDMMVARTANLIEQGLQSRGYSIVLCNSNEDAGREAEHLRLLDQRGVDGLIVAPITTDQEELLKNFSSTLPLVVLDRPIDGIKTTVAGDHEQAAEILCRALHDAGVRRVAAVCGPRRLTTHRLRMRVVEKWFEVTALREGPTFRITGRAAYEHFKTVPRQTVDAIICSGLTLATGVMQAITPAEARDRPPVLGVFDWLPMRHLLPMPILCSVIDLYDLADGCVRQLMPLLGNLRELAHMQDQAQPLIFPPHLESNPAFDAWAKSRRM